VISIEMSQRKGVVFPGLANPLPRRVPTDSIPFIIGVFASIDVNPALIAVVLGMDRILDM
jgi:hypothetical protein